MGTEKSNTLGTPYNYMVRLPIDESLDKPLPLHWTTLQAYNNSGSTPSPFLNQNAAGSYMSPYMWPYQANSTLLQSDALHNPRKLSIKPTVAGDAVLAFSEMVHRTFGEQNLNSMKRCAKSLQPESLITKELRENGNGSSIPKNDRDGVLWSIANGSKGSPHEDHDTNNDFPSTKEQCILMLENANLTELNQNLETGLIASGTDVQLAMEKDEIRKERKRQSNRESAKRSRKRKEKECEELHKNMEILKDENSLLTQRLKRLSEDCLELSNENDSIQEELVKLYGPESIADILPIKPA